MITYSKVNLKKVVGQSAYKYTYVGVCYQFQFFSYYRYTHTFVLLLCCCICCGSQQYYRLQYILRMYSSSTTSTMLCMYLCTVIVLVLLLYSTYSVCVVLMCKKYSIALSKFYEVVQCTELACIFYCMQISLSQLFILFLLEVNILSVCCCT